MTQQDTWVEDEVCHLLRPSENGQTGRQIRDRVLKAFNELYGNLNPSKTQAEEFARNRTVIEFGKLVRDILVNTKLFEQTGVSAVCEVFEKQLRQERHDCWLTTQGVYSKYTNHQHIVAAAGAAASKAITG
jgi:hypothetical protein